MVGVDRTPVSLLSPMKQKNYIAVGKDGRKTEMVENRINRCKFQFFLGLDQEQIKHVSCFNISNGYVQRTVASHAPHKLFWSRGVGCPLCLKKNRLGLCQSHATSAHD